MQLQQGKTSYFPSLFHSWSYSSMSYASVGHIIKNPMKQLSSFLRAGQDVLSVFIPNHL